jgi:hypothetical protein
MKVDLMANSMTENKPSSIVRATKVAPLFLSKTRSISQEPVTSRTEQRRRKQIDDERGQKGRRMNSRSKDSHNNFHRPKSLANRNPKHILNSCAEGKTNEETQRKIGVIFRSNPASPLLLLCWFLVSKVVQIRLALGSLLKLE